MKSKKLNVRATSRLCAWEMSLYRDVLAALAEPKNRPFARFNFLVHAGNVFFLEKSPWWHAVPSDARKVALRLRRNGVSVVSVECVSSRASWTPYFGRKHDEEPNRGWNDLTIKVMARRTQDAPLLRLALRAHRAHLGRREAIP